MNGTKFVIDINTKLSPEIMEYIFDCWVSFVVGDLGLTPKDLPMVLS